jgi:hypothetical protein
MNRTHQKSGTSEILAQVTLVSRVDNLSAVPVPSLGLNKPRARVFRGPVPHRLPSRICGECGFTEFFVDYPKYFLATRNRLFLGAGVT